jgi:OOP family OmpA-OmpF porin
MTIRGKLLATSCLALAGFILPASAWAQAMTGSSEATETPGGTYMNPQPATGPYVSLGAGVNIMTPQNYSIPNGAAPALPGTARTGHEIFRPDYAGTIGIGYGLGNGLRVELDGDFFRNNVKKQDDNFLGQSRAAGGVNTYGAIANVFYDIPVPFPVRPYVGGGVGYMWQKFQHLHSGFTGDNFSGTYGSFAYDVIAGVAFDITSVPGLAVTAEYQYTELTSNRKYLDTGYQNVAQFNHSPNHAFMLGLRYALFQPAPAPAAPPPAPAPVAAPAPAPARTYLVFFNWDRANLTPRAMQIVSEAAQASQSTHVTRLNVNGYTDTSGTPAYNMKLSYRRANNVAAQLVQDGVSKSDIVIKGYGETHLLVPTGPGVREPQNRRVEIILG